MKVVKIYNQHRRDCHADFECEGCGAKDTTTSAYDDRYYWDNVVPNRKCKNCGKSSKDLGLNADFIQTKYPDGFQV